MQKHKFLGLLVFLIGLVSMLFNVCIKHAQASSWVSTGQWPHGISIIYALTTGTDGKIWAAGDSGRTAYWNGSSWVNTGIWPHGSYNYIYALTTGTDDKIWAAGQYGYTAYWNGSSWVNIGNWPNNSTIYALTTGTDDKIWAAGQYGYTAYWNGSSWVNTGVWPHGSVSYIHALTTGTDGKIWAAGDSGRTAYWNGSSWVNTGIWPHGSSTIYALTTGTDGKIWAAGGGGNTAYWNGSSWVNTGIWPHGTTIYALSTGTDGKIWAAGDSGRTAYWNGSSWVNTGIWPHGSSTIYALTTGTDGKIWAAGGGGNTAYWNANNTSLSLIPSPNGLTGQLVINPQVSGRSGVLVQVQTSSDGVNFTNQGIPGAGTITITPTASTTYVRLELKYERSQGNFQTVYSNVVPVPTLLSPNLNISTGVRTWDKARGRSWVTLSYPVTNAAGYKLHINDGTGDRPRDLGNVTSWDSRTAKVFPFPGELPENNSISSNIFRWDASGLDLEDTALRLYRSTIGTVLDNDPRYIFRVTAYNQWMETYIYASSSSRAITMPNATDTQQPGGSVNATSLEGFEKTYNQNIKVSVNASDAGSGILKIELSNDGVSYTERYSATKNADNGTGILNYSNTLDWSVPLGAGTKVIYVRVTDSVGNQTVLTDTVAFADDMIPPSLSLMINDGAQSTTSNTVNLTINAYDNASSSSQIQMSFSNNGTLWSPWEPYNLTKTWDLTNTTYGGVTGAGKKKVYVRVYDQAQNIGMASAEIGYNPTPPTASTPTVTNGVSGTYNGKSVVFVKGDMPTLNISATGAFKMRYDTGFGWSDWENYATSKEVVLPKSSGICKVRYQVQDVYGVTSSVQEVLMVVDSQAPVIQSLTTVSGARATSGSSIQLSVTATDDLSTQLYYDVNGGTKTALPADGIISAPVSGSGIVNIIVRIYDEAGNYSTRVIGIRKLSSLSSTLSKVA